jgi:hypothetical protein
MELAEFDIEGGGHLAKLTRAAQTSEEIKAEIKRLEEERVAVAEEMRLAAADKDFRENAPLQAAREKASSIEDRLKTLNHRLHFPSIADRKKETEVRRQRHELEWQTSSGYSLLWRGRRYEVWETPTGRFQIKDTQDDVEVATHLTKESAEDQLYILTGKPHSARIRRYRWTEVTYAQMRNEIRQLDRYEELDDRIFGIDYRGMIIMAVCNGSVNDPPHKLFRKYYEDCDKERMNEDFDFMHEEFRFL